MNKAADFRRSARASLKGKWLPAVLAGLVAWIFGVTDGAGGLDFNLTYADGNAHLNLQALGQNIYLDEILQSPAARAALMSYVTFFSILLFIVFIVQLILGGVVTAGYAKFNLDLVDGKEPQVKTLLNYFPQWKTMVAAYLLQVLYITLWSLLLIIPGIIAAYRYAMTSYILAENPEMRAGEAITRSKEMMVGNKWRLFCLSFSFIGWAILCVFTLGIGNLFLVPYEQAATAAFYRDITASSGDVRLEPAMLSDQL